MPKGAPEPIIKKLNEAMMLALNSSSVVEKLLKIGVTVMPPDKRTPQAAQACAACGVLLSGGITVTPIFRSFSTTDDELSASIIASFSFFMIGSGAPLGKNSPLQKLA